uniref:Peptidase_S9 domain-containing protein n=1 Tax=Meloidogyne hapla TaxID=6305 RepID=A0A1I8C169_MELHA
MTTRSSSLGIKDVELLGGDPTIGDEESSLGGHQERNWRGIITALLVIAIMCSLIALAVLVLSPPLIDADQPQQRISLSDVLSLRFLSFVESLEWIDSRRLLVKYTEGIKILELIDEETTKWEWKNLEGDLFRYGKPNSVDVSSDARYLIFHYYTGKRSSKSSTFRIYDTQTETFENVGPEKSGEENVKVMAWNPKGDDFAYVYNNNVFYQSDPLTLKSQQITNDSSDDILNGVADWLYEEEILQTPQALWWSKDGQFLAFLTIDNREVPHVPIMQFAHHQYPNVRKQPYPKVDEKHLPQIWLSIWSKGDGTLKRINVEGIPESSRIYLFSAQWVELYGQQILIAVWANRYQNQIIFSLCSFNSSKCLPNLTQKFTFNNLNYGKIPSFNGPEASPNLKIETNSNLILNLWAEPEDSKVRFYSSDAFYTLLPHRRPSNNGENVFTHLACINVSDGFERGRETFLPAGNFDVEKINWLSHERQKIYFTAAAPLPSQRHLYVIPSFPDSHSIDPICLTCNISINCTFHESNFSPNEKNNNNLSTQFVILNCKGPGTPHILITKLNSDGDKLEKVLEFGRNEALEQALHTYRFPSVHFTSVKLKSGLETLVKILVPYGVVLDEKRPEKRYPVLIDDYVVVFIDGRGSGHQGWRMKQPLYGNFGTVEIDDQIDTMRELLRLYPVLDSKRVGIWGWSYGGFASARAVQRDHSVNRTFQCVASVAPVSNFKYYDATYAERYMGEVGADAYERTDLTQDVRPFHNVSFMLAHGSADDNVHYQNTAEFVRALTDENVQFEMMVYTDDSHNLSTVRWHLYTMFVQFLKKCFNGIKN